MADERAAETEKREKCGLLLGTHYEIIEKCLINLDMRQLKAVSSVCRAWNKVAKSIARKRSKPFSVVVKVSEMPLVSEILRTMFQDAMGHTSSLCFLMASPDFVYKSHENFADLRKSVSPSCVNLIIPGSGIVGTTTDGRVTALYEYIYFPQRHKMKVNVGISGVLFPELPGVKVYTFTDGPEWHSLDGAEYFLMDNVRSPEGKVGKFIDVLPEDEVIKCAVFTTFTGPKVGHTLYKMIVDRQKEPFAFGGYFANEEESIAYDNGEECKIKKSRACGFFLTGENVIASSIVITTQTEKDIKDGFEKLKRCNFPDRNTICLLFACVGRHKLKREVELYRMTFPYIPLSGCTGYGEFGVDYLPDINKDTQEFSPKKARLEENVGFGLSSIYVMIHWRT